MTRATASGPRYGRLTHLRGKRQVLPEPCGETPHACFSGAWRASKRAWPRDRTSWSALRGRGLRPAPRVWIPYLSGVLVVAPTHGVRDSCHEMLVIPATGRTGSTPARPVG
jgi:hypothetical protein